MNKKKVKKGKLYSTDKLLQKAIDLFPTILKEKERAYKYKEKILKAFKPFSESLYRDQQKRGLHQLSREDSKKNFKK